MAAMDPKPLEFRAYGSIPHLPGGRLGPGDHRINDGQARWLLEKARDRHDLVIVEEKLDGANVSVARVDGVIVPLTRSGARASASRYEMHQLFHVWALINSDRFLGLLEDGERLVGEWLAQAHGTRYALPHEPFVPFDILRGQERATVAELHERCRAFDFTNPRVIHRGGPIAIPAVRERLEPSGHGALDPVEGAVWRLEREGKVELLAKWVRPDKVDSQFFQGDPVWSWRPGRAR
jgi:hypothetical protein